MPTTNPRVNVTLSPTLFALVSDLAQLQRVSRAMVLRDLLETVEPQMVQAVAMMRAAESLSKEARGRVARDMEGALRSMEKDTNKAMQLAAGVTSDLVAQAEAIRGRRPARTKPAGSARRTAQGASVALAERSDPPSSKRGVKSSKRGAGR